MSIDSLRVLDESKMFSILLSLGDHWERAIEIGEGATLPDTLRGAKHLLWTGMGGSAMGGSFLQATLAKELRIPLVVNRDYELPEFVSKDTLVVAVSYSGDTEETLAALQDAMARHAKILCLTSGGQLAKQAREHNLPLVSIPGGMMPRCGIMYLYAPLLRVLVRLDYLKDETIRPAAAETRQVLAQCVEEFSREKSLPYTLAKELRGVLPIIYAPVSLEAAALRWRGQFNENAKTFATCHTLPEMNHNEIEGWRFPSEVLAQAHVILLRDAAESPRVRQRMEITQELIAAHARDVTNVSSRGESWMARFFSLVVLADFTSYYLALFNGVDPTPVDRIGQLKAALARADD